MTPAVDAIEVVAGIVRDGAGRLLITRRPDGGHLAGLWEFPGGKKRAGESDGAALRRELQEELGVTVDPGRVLLTTDHAYTDRRVRIAFLEARIVAGDPVALEVADFRWVSVGELTRYEFPEADREMIRRLSDP